MIESGPPTFKCYPVFMDWLRTGKKRFDIRLYDPNDQRISRLLLVRRQSTLDIPVEVVMAFVNTEDPKDVLVFQYLGIAFSEDMPGWCIFKLGNLVKGTSSE